MVRTSIRACFFWRTSRELTSSDPSIHPSVRPSVHPASQPASHPPTHPPHPTPPHSYLRGGHRHRLRDAPVQQSGRGAVRGLQRRESGVGGPRVRFGGGSHRGFKGGCPPGSTEEFWHQLTASTFSRSPSSALLPTFFGGGFPY